MAMKVLPCLLVSVSVCLISLPACLSVNPGVKIRATKKGVEYANQVAQAEIAEQLKNLKIPDQSGDGHHYSYTITNIRETGCTPPTSAITLVPAENAVTWSLSNLALGIHCDWRVKYRQGWVKISTSGSVDVKVKRVSLVETIGLGVDKTGRPTVSSKHCSANVGDVDIDFHGGTAFILNLFKGTFEDKIKEVLQDKICQEIVTAVNVKANQSLKKMKVNVEIDHRFLLDYALVAAPSITANFAELLDKGEVFWEKDKKECPFSPTPIPPLTDYSNMVNIWITDYTANTFLYQAQTYGYLVYNLTKKDLSPDQQSYLNTTCSLKCIGTLIPQIKAKYPNSDVELHINSSAMPRAIFAASNMSASLQAAVELWAHTPDDKKHYMITLNMNVSLTVKAAVKNERVTGSIIGHSFNVSVSKSEIGPVSGKAVTLVLNGILDYAVVPELNKIGERGFDLPVTDELQFLNAKLLLQKGFLLISTDVKYKGVQDKAIQDKGVHAQDAQKPPNAKDKALYFAEESSLIKETSVYIVEEKASYKQLNPVVNA